MGATGRAGRAARPRLLTASQQAPVRWRHTHARRKRRGSGRLTIAIDEDIVVPIALSFELVPDQAGEEAVSARLQRFGRRRKDMASHV